MENEDEVKKNEAKVKKRLAKKTSYKIMLQNHDSMENPHVQQKFKKMKENIFKIYRNILNYDVFVMKFF